MFVIQVCGGIIEMHKEVKTTFRVRPHDLKADLHIMDHGNCCISSVRLERQNRTYQTGSVEQNIWAPHQEHPTAAVGW